MKITLAVANDVPDWKKYIKDISAQYMPVIMHITWGTIDMHCECPGCKAKRNKK